jgi:uncharacterized protein
MKGMAAQSFSALAAGLLFGAGLVVSGMTDPNAVLGFLDFFGAWDASLMLVMAGAVAVHAVAYRLITRRPAPLYAERFALPARRDIDAQLLLGASVFGLGWGISGFCPGPSIVALASADLGVIAFVAAMLAGMLAGAKLEQLARR